MTMIGFDEQRPQDAFFRWALAVSVLLHVIVLMLPAHEPKPPKSAQRLQTRIVQKAPPKQVAVEAPPQIQPPKPTPKARAPQRPKRLLTRPTASPEAPKVVAEPPPKFSKAERQEMDDFLKSLEDEQKAKPQPSLAQRALAMAREMGREPEPRNPDEDKAISIERIPDSPPVDPFSLEMYLDGMVNKLNRSSAFVKHDPGKVGTHRAVVQLRLNPNGTIKSFEVLREADQHDEIGFIKKLVERAAPYSAFPPDILRSAQSLAITICVMPPEPGGGFGFTRDVDGRGC